MPNIRKLLGLVAIGVVGAASVGTFRSSLSLWAAADRMSNSTEVVLEAGRKPYSLSHPGWIDRSPGRNLVIVIGANCPECTRSLSSYKRALEAIPAERRPSVTVFALDFSDPTDLHAALAPLRSFAPKIVVPKQALEFMVQSGVVGAPLAISVRDDGSAAVVITGEPAPSDIDLLRDELLNVDGRDRDRAGTTFRNGGPFSSFASFSELEMQRASEDCDAYMATAARVASGKAPGTFVVTDGKQLEIKAANSADAERLLQLVKTSTAICYLGRRSSPEGVKSFPVQYWKKTGALPKFPDEDCNTYDPKAVDVRNSGNDYRVIEGEKHLMMTLHTKEDADRALKLVRDNSSQCFIGRNSGKGIEFVTSYWR